MKSIVFVLLTIFVLNLSDKCRSFPAGAQVYKYFDDTPDKKLNDKEKIKKINIQDVKLNEWVIVKDKAGEIQKSQVIGWIYYDESTKHRYIEILWYPLGKNLPNNPYQNNKFKDTV